jgi:hypothetical protein
MPLPTITKSKLLLNIDSPSVSISRSLATGALVVTFFYHFEHAPPLCSNSGD